MFYTIDNETLLIRKPGITAEAIAIQILSNQNEHTSLLRIVTDLKQKEKGNE
jgi:hypothetical protein